LLAALRDDWQPVVATEAQTDATHKRPVRSGNRNIGNSNEISANIRAAIEFDFGFETFGEKKLCEMLADSWDFVRDITTGAAQRWLSLLGLSGTGKDFGRASKNGHSRSCSATEPAFNSGAAIAVDRPIFLDAAKSGI